MTKSSSHLDNQFKRSSTIPTHANEIGDPRCSAPRDTASTTATETTGTGGFIICHNTFSGRVASVVASINRNNGVKVCCDASICRYYCPRSHHAVPHTWKCRNICITCSFKILTSLSQPIRYSCNYAACDADGSSSRNIDDLGIETGGTIEQSRG